MNNSGAEFGSDANMWQHGLPPRGLPCWMPYYTMGFPNHSSQWYVSQPSFFGGPPGIFVHCYETQQCPGEVGFDSHDSADMDVTFGSKQTGTTLFVRNLPSFSSRTCLWELLESLDLSGKFDLIYVPVNFKTGMTYGYGFVNMITPEAALSAMPKIAGSTLGGETVDVCLSTHHQGLHTFVARYRNSPVLHGSVPEEFQPLMFKSGQPVDFPCPTRNIKAPALEKCRTVGRMQKSCLR